MIARRVAARHAWLPELVLTRSALGPHGTDLLAVAAGRHPHLTAALTAGTFDPAPQFETTMSRVLAGLLGE